MKTHPYFTSFVFILCLGFLLPPIEGANSEVTSNSSEISCPQLLGGMTEHHPMVSEIAARADRFNNYFKSASQIVVERDYLMTLAKYALIAKEHIQLIGPPGNAKSMFANLVYGGITDEATGKTSYFKTSFNKETTLADTHGPIDWKALEDVKEVRRLYNKGILGYHLGFFDENLDISARALRNVLDVLAERSHGQNGSIHQGITWSVINASNKYIAQAYEQFGGNEPQAVFDRIAFIAYIAPDFQFVGNWKKLDSKAKGRNPAGLPPLYFQDIAALQDKTYDVVIPDYIYNLVGHMVYSRRPEIEAMEDTSRRKHQEKVRSGEFSLPPWKATKYNSLRTQGKAYNILRAIVVNDWAERGGSRPLVAGIEDVQKLESFFGMEGPSGSFFEKELDRSTDPYERDQLETVQKERDFFQGMMKTTQQEFNEAFYKHDWVDLAASRERYPKMLAKEKAEFLEQFGSIYREAEISKPTDTTHPWDLTPQQIAYQATSETVAEWLRKMESPEKAEALLKKWNSELGQEKDKVLREVAEREQNEQLAKEKSAAEKKKQEKELIAKGGTFTNAFSLFAKERSIDLQFIKNADQKSFAFNAVKPAGPFQMGSPKRETGHSDDENPVQVTLTKPFEMMQTPVTQLQWYLVMGNNPSQFKEQQHSDGDFITINSETLNANHPVEKVSWEDAQEFIKKLNEKDPKYNYRLPTEAEWELAARSGTTTAYSFGNDESQLGDHAFFSGNSGSRTHAIGLKKPNPGGFYDIHGNVWEWVQDWYDNKLPGGVDPQGPSTGSFRVVRGGSWADVAQFLRSAGRGGDHPGPGAAVSVFAL